MKRGDVVTTADRAAGDYGGKPRVGVVIQSDLFNATHPSIAIAPITHELRNDMPAFRITIEPTAENGLRLVSQVMTDKITTYRRERVRPAIGHVDADSMTRVSRAIALWQGFV